MSAPRERPHVFVNVAISVDGRIDSALGEGGGFSSREDKRRLAAIRERADALVVGAATIRNEDPPLHIASEDARQRRRDAGRDADLIVAVVSGSGRIPPDARFLREPARSRLLALPERASADAAGAADKIEGLHVVRAGRERVEPRRLLDELARRGANDVLVEGGGEVIAAFAAEDLVDELYVTLVPVLIGGREAPGPFGGPPRALADRLHLELASCEAIGGELFLRYLVRRADD